MAITIKPDPLETSPLLSHPQHQRPDHDINGHGDSNAGYRVDLENSQPPEPPSAEEDSAVTVDEPSTRMLVAIMTASWIGVFFAALDTTIVATLTGPISSSFDSLSLLSWLATGYLIANSACQPLSGKLTDIFSRRTGLLFSNIFFGLGTLMCGLAPSAGVMIAGRVVAGIGGGGLTCITTFVTSDLIPLRRRGLWQGYGNLIYGLGMGSGGVVGGALADSLSWRWAFLLQLPFIVVSTVLVWILLDPHLPRRAPLPTTSSNNTTESTTKSSALHRIDFTGSALLVVSLVLLLLGLNSGGNQLPWSHPLIITSLVLAGVTLVGFIYFEARAELAFDKEESSDTITTVSEANPIPTPNNQNADSSSPPPKFKPEPIIPVVLIARTRTILAACLANWFSTMSAFLALYYIPLYLQVRGLSSTAAGLRVIPFAAAMSVGSLGSGYLMRKTGRYWGQMVFVMLLFVAGTALICTFKLDSPAWQTYLYVTPLGMAYGSMLTITLVAMISAADHAHQAVITAASYAFRSTGSTIGITVASAVFQNVLTTELQSQFGSMPGSEGEIRRIRDNLKELDRLPRGWDRGVVLDIYMDALRAAFVAGLILAVLAAAAGFAMKEHVLHKNLARK
ncbi:Multidrug resistance protein fnx1 [Exophiala dermatitidis]